MEKNLFNSMKTVAMTLLLFFAFAGNINANTGNPMPSVQETQGGYVVITGVNVMLRLGPGVNYGYLTYSNGAPKHPAKGARLTYLGETNNWYRVSFDGAAVFVSKQFAHFVSDGYSSSYNNGGQRMVRITGTGVHLRRGPGLDYSYANYRPYNGQKLVYLGQCGDWYKVRYNGNVYFVFKQYGQLTY